MIFNYKSNDVLIPGTVLGIFQEGGQVMEGEPAVETDPIETLMEMAVAGVEGDCEAATQACQMILDMLQEQMGQQPEQPM